AFWDTETYCLPFYLFSDPQAARNLLLFRYATLPMAKERAKELDLNGACYPIATLNGHESCALWQHASLQPQPSTAVAFAIDHYVRNTGDEAFLGAYGLEMLIEISRYLLARGDYNPDKTKFGFYGVMGPDEFQMMVHHNAYTNYMGMATFDTTLKALTQIKKVDPDDYRAVLEKTGLKTTEIKAFREAMEKTFLPYDPKTRLYEQHQGYFDLPHIDIKKIPEKEFPLYAHWSYDRIYRNDMIKQPDVLMFLFLYNSRFSLAVKRANYEFYEPRCIHESSLSPSIHSVLAAELDKDAEAAKFFEFATRMDLDDFNRNAAEGLHLTSIAAAWVNIVYGFGGLRSDGALLRIAPKLPPAWTGYAFHLNYRGVRLSFEVVKGETSITADRDLDEPLVIYREKVWLKAGTTVFAR
ncbi:MAG: glycosyl hydrolase family 65 protein, partial [bacterium]